MILTGSAIRRIYALIAFALTLLACPSHSNSTVEPPLVRAPPKARQLQQISSQARALVAEIDGRARGSLLSESLAEAARRGSASLLQLALELQSVVHAKRGNYLYALYCSLKRYHAKGARAWANHLAGMGVAIGITSGQALSLAHLDPTASVSATPDPQVARTPASRWVDDFKTARYRPEYRPFQRGWLSQVLQLRYKDGTVLDIDIRVISDNHDPAVSHSMARAYIGPGGRIFPLRLNRDTTPRLWRAKHEQALAGMHRSNRDFEGFLGLTLAGVFSNLPLGLVAPLASPSAAAGTGRTGRVGQSARARRSSQAGEMNVAAAGPGRDGSAVPAQSQIVRRSPRAALAVRAPQGKTPWPPQPPAGPKPGVHEANAASWRYQRYVHRLYREGKTRADVLPCESWQRRYFEPTLRGGRPGRPGGPDHRADVLRNNQPNKLESSPIGNRVPDGMGQPGQTVIIRGNKIQPQGHGVVIVESDHLIRGGTLPNSAARAQMRDIRKAAPDATLVVTDQANPKAAPLIYPPGKQPPPPGPLPKNQAPVVPYP